MERPFVSYRREQAANSENGKEESEKGSSSDKAEGTQSDAVAAADQSEKKLHVAEGKSESGTEKDDVSQRRAGSDNGQFFLVDGDRTRAYRPFFSIVGSVDGIRDELAPGDLGDEDDDSWFLRQVIVECKHRMRQIQPIPPLYEQIQAAAYCFLYEVDDADIVQVLRTELADDEGDEPTQKRQKSEDDEEKKSDMVTEVDGKKQGDDDQSGEKTSSEVAEDRKGRAEPAAPTHGSVEAQNGSSARNRSTVTLSVNRVSLDDPLMQHRQNWTAQVLPRLRSFVEAVYSIRRDEGLRYTFLQATASDENQQSVTAAAQMLLELCPWLQQCSVNLYNP
jgi:hypothetical protein